MKILDKYWFTNKDGTIGIVKVETDYDGVKYYIGHVPGNNEQDDMEYIANWGSTFPIAAGNLLFSLKS